MIKYSVTFMRENVFCRCLTVLLVTIIFFVNFLLPVKAEDEEISADEIAENMIGFDI